jgi:hypothetical protein
MMRPLPSMPQNHFTIKVFGHLLHIISQLSQMELKCPLLLKDQELVSYATSSFRQGQELGGAVE